MYYLFIIFLFVYGTFSFLKPEIIWKIQHFLDVKDGEPTEYALFGNKVLGVGFVILGIFLLTDHWGT